MHFIKVNELKLNQIEWFSFFTFKCTAANIAELFCVALLENNERLLHQLQTHETGKILDSWNDFVKKNILYAQNLKCAWYLLPLEKNLHVALTIQYYVNVYLIIFKKNILVLLKIFHLGQSFLCLVYAKPLIDSILGIGFPTMR